MKKILFASLLVTGMYAAEKPVVESAECNQAVEDLYVSDREARRERERGRINKRKKQLKLSIKNIERVKKECTMRPGEVEYLNEKRDLILSIIKRYGG